MLYPVYVHPGDDHHAHGVTIPDFPGCFSAADSWDELAGNVQQAVELYCEGEDMDIPSPSSLDILNASSDYSGGIWAMVDIDTTRLETRAERINITLPGQLLRRIDAYLKDRAQSRSGFLAQAAAEALRQETKLRSGRNPRRSIGPTKKVKAGATKKAAAPIRKRKAG